MENATSTSPRYSLDWIDRQKILKGLLIATGGATLTFLADALPGIDFGQYQMIVYPLMSALLNAAIKWFSDYSKK